MKLRIVLPFVLLFSGVQVLDAETVVLEPRFLHLRNAEPREWASFPEKAFGTSVTASFDLDSPQEFSLVTLRQKGTKQTWNVLLNDTKIGSLPRDHNHLEHGIAIPKGLLKATGNLLEISTGSETPDDIRVGDIRLHRRTMKLVDDETAEGLSRNRGYKRAIPEMSATVHLSATDTGTGKTLPCRFTVIDTETGGLVFIGAESDDQIAVREGVVYSLDGRASIQLAGDATHPRSYRIFCGRGFEYSMQEADLFIDGSRKESSFDFSITREVETPGLVACDPHLHTFEFDRHGDCTLTERLISIAGEGVELPISTGHDKHIDYRSEADRIGASQWFTSVLGCEVTTHLGHFNTFPILPDSAPAEHKLRPWPNIFENIFATPGVKVCILNHGRDVHRGYTPLHPDNFDLASGTFKDGKILKANAMELINSGAQQTNPMQLVHDWFALLKSGHGIAGIGSSDSHTVNFAIPGQGRTYIRCEDDDASAINVDFAVQSVLRGKTMVSFGLLTTLSIKDDQVSVDVRGPGWTRAAELQIFRNGKSVHTEKISPETGNRAGEKFTGTYSLKELEADPGDFVCAVATGPGITASWWPSMKPYQPDSPEFSPFVMGISEALWIP